ncbi:hypothetical protein CC85DRAFT_303686 [Cutaneotrichosporon oleaginosum]|uniref:Small-subunit processome Utp12 domain-containing protein n=1 Tax=Cutaneotrichosporon oleaginosum TaxID=879819 RepID=A0A0J0XIJ9_9TREE|nr:uncharacterized protein CC85DRAFT_303686 [Cutaneotrichosporon oleaginosum]KLT40900.1 hypothetical protein CC85DRAFT_303686 [Cutaneotrichosporon oleaginosum]TXT15393.1 hypothetical protein COLE_01586 [Cutaneotrichosporon oleaginosum]
MARSSVAGPSRQRVPAPSSAVSGFNPARTHFALALPVLGAADKVQVWDVAADSVIAEFELPGAAKAVSVAWSSVSSSGSTKRRRRRKSGSEAAGTDEDVLLVASIKGDQSNLAVYLPSKGEALRTISLPGKVTAMWSDEYGVIIATESNLLVLGPEAAAIAHTFDLPSSVKAPSAVALLPTSTGEELHAIVGAKSVVAVHLSTTSSSITHTSSPLPVSTTSVTSLQPLPNTQQGASFLVVCEDDRTVNQYTFPGSPTAAAKLSYRYTSPTLSPVHSVALSDEFVAALHDDGEISVFPIALTDLNFARPKSNNKPAKVKLVEGKEGKTASICRVEFAPVDDGAPAVLSCGRMVGGGRVKWYSATIEQPEGGLATNVVVKTDAQDLVAPKDTAKGSNNLQRYTAPAHAVQAADDEKDESAAALPADVDMADLTLGERLLAAPTGPQPNGDAAAPPAKGATTAASLTRLLVQALHTSDPALLTLCLSHRDPVLIRNTVRKLPVDLSLPLVKACVERLGQGKGANRRGGGRGGAQNEQQGRGTVEWVKGVLIERGHILMTIPSLPGQLATLSNLLASRMELYEPLVSLSGRLDLALSQIALRRQAAEAMEVDKGDGEHYVEGESDDEVPIEVGEEDEDDIEDINMMGGSSDDEDEDGDEDDSEDEDESDDPLESDEEGLLDLEAEESDDDEDEEGDSDDE